MHTYPHIYLYKEEVGVETYKEFKIIYFHKVQYACVILVRFS